MSISLNKIIISYAGLCTIGLTYLIHKSDTFIHNYHPKCPQNYPYFLEENRNRKKKD